MQISLQPGTFVDMIGSLQLAASNKPFGNPSRYEGKIDIFDFWRKGITLLTLGFQIINFSLTQKFNWSMVIEDLFFSSGSPRIKVLRWIFFFLRISKAPIISLIPLSPIILEWKIRS